MAKFDDIIGYENEKDELRKICDMLKDREKYLRFGITPPKALLLWGDPGLGKTLMAKALIDESGRRSFACRKDRSDGEFVNAIRETFDKAKENAPSVILLDDMDKFAEDNLNMDSNKEEFVTIQSCLENLGECDVFVIATANCIHNIPDSLMRSGRFGNRIEVTAPSYGDTVKIIAHFLDGKRISPDVTPEKLAKLINGHSCASLKEVVNLAGTYAVYNGRDLINIDDIIKGATRVIFHSIEREKMDDDAIKLIAYHEAGHVIGAVAAGKKIGFVSIMGFGNNHGCVRCYDNEIRTSYEEVLDDVTEFMAGKAAFEAVSGKTDIGTESDFDKSFEMLEPFIAGCCTEGFEYGDYLRLRAKSSDTVTAKVYMVIGECYKKAAAMINANRCLLDEIANILYEKKIVFGDEIEPICAEYGIAAS